MLRRLTLLIATLALGAVALVGCGGIPEHTYSRVASFFDGAMAVEYKQYGNDVINDVMQYRFYQSGTYQVSYSIPPEKGTKDYDRLPENFTQTVQAPTEVVKEKYRLPAFLRVTVTWNGQTESHSFA